MEKFTMTDELKKKLEIYRLTDEEFQLIQRLLGRDPRGVEWALFSALWSEHCSYKSSKVHLKKFAKTLNDSVLNAEGENAGVLDLGQGERIVFKMESHNHPSFIEPYQGAATGVGGILRDIFTMGARPIALADYLCFGESGSDRMNSIVDGVVRGIGGYGNCVGVPTVTGQTCFDRSYNGNILVNAMAVGLIPPDSVVALSAAKGPGNWVVYVGAKTGKDGIHGASMASESFDEGSEAKRPNVQIGDPFYEKLLIESCLEVLSKNLVVSIQDMGAAGLTSSSFEMSSKGQVGMKLHLDRVPLRDYSMSPEEILLSESQERMLLVCEPSQWGLIEQVFKRWGLDAVVIGEIIKEREIQLIWKGEILTQIDPDLLVEKAPQFQRPFEFNKPTTFSDQTLEVDSPSFMGFAPIYSQYDQRVGLMTARGCEHDVAILRLPESGRGLAIAVGGRPSLLKKNAYFGAWDAAVYPALQMAVKGAKIAAMTDCLNFGNPEKQEVMSDFVASVEALVEASILLEAPVVSGNVSFYNETLGCNIIPTPAIGAVGIRENVVHIPEDQFQREKSKVWLIGAPLFYSKHFSDPLKREFIYLMREIAINFSQHIYSSQVVGDSGVFWALAKMCLGGLGMKSHPQRKTHEFQKGNFLYQTLWEINKDFDFIDNTKKLLKSLSTTKWKYQSNQSGIQFLQPNSKVFIEIKEMGTTVKGQLDLGEGAVVSLEELKSDYESGLRRKFESLE